MSSTTETMFDEVTFSCERIKWKTSNTSLIRCSLKKNSSKSECKRQRSRMFQRHLVALVSTASSQELGTEFFNASTITVPIFAPSKCERER